MISFLFRIAIRAATVQKYRFISLTLTIAVGSALLVILSSLYFNAEDQLELELSGVPNIVLEPQTSIVNITQLTTEDVTQLKSTDHFWRNNVINAVPVRLIEGQVNDDKNIKIAGTWFYKSFTVNNESYTFGLLKFKGWKYQGSYPDKNSVIIGQNLTDKIKGQFIPISLRGKEKSLKVAGVINTGSFWDDYIFVDLRHLNDLVMTENPSSVDKILVSTLIKPKDELAIQAELYGAESLSPAEYEAWYCSPYVSTIAHTAKEVVPKAQVKIMRRITEVQEGIIKASSGVFAALFIVTLITAIMAIFSAEKMYITSKTKDFGIMAALGASKPKTFIQLMLEISMASFLSVLITYGLSKTFVGIINSAVFGVKFTANTTLLLTSAILPLTLALIVALILVKKTLNRNVIENLN